MIAVYILAAAMVYISVGKYVASYLGRRDFEGKRRELRKDKIEHGECRYPNLPSDFCMTICSACNHRVGVREKKASAE
jgi:hypothetical protein